MMSQTRLKSAYCINLTRQLTLLDVLNVT